MNDVLFFCWTGVMRILTQEIKIKITEDAELDDRKEGNACLFKEDTEQGHSEQKYVEC